MNNPPYQTGPAGFPAPQASSRFGRHFPIVAALAMNPLFLFIGISILAVGAAFFSVHYTLSLLILTLPFISYYLERNLIGRIILTPFAMIAFWWAMGAGVGIALITFADFNAFDLHLFQVQLVTLCVAPLAWFAYRLGFGRIPRMTFPAGRRAFERDVLRPLAWIGWFFILLQVGRTLMLARLGALDRGDSGLVALGSSHFGVWTYFNLLPRLDMFGFSLMSVVWQRSLGFGKALLIGLLIIYFLIALVSGSRGIVFYPIIYIGAGFYFFRTIRSVKIDLLAMSGVLLFAPLIVFIDSYRNTDSYRATTTMDFAGRIAAVDDGIERMINRDDDTGRDRAGYFTLGAALLGVSDATIYEMTPGGIPYAGFNNIEAILYTFVPAFTKEDKPPLLDSNIVMWSYVNRVDRVGRAISLPADAYRRFGWLGIPFAVAFFFWLYGVICRRFYKIYLYKNALLGVLLILLSFSFFQAIPTGTILESWWHLSYNVVKHLVVLYLGYLALRSIMKIRNQGGAIHYRRRG